MLLRDIRGAGPPEGRGVLGLVEDLLDQTVRLLDQKLTSCVWKSKRALVC